jgi:hypothetical protein
MENAFGMTITETFYDLLEYDFCNILLESSSASDIIKQITSSTEFNDEDNMFLSFKELIESHDVTMPCSLQNYNFLHHLLCLGLFAEILLVD